MLLNNMEDVSISYRLILKPALMLLATVQMNRPTESAIRRVIMGFLGRKQYFPLGDEHSPRAEAPLRFLTLAKFEFVCRDTHIFSWHYRARDKARSVTIPRHRRGSYE